MSSHPFRIAPLLAAALVAGCGGPSGPAGPELRAGAAAVDITPVDEWPLPLVGNFGYHPAESAHDPLYARAIAIEADGETVVVAVVDSCYIPRETLDDAKARASEATGIPTSRMLVSATHTHSAPPAATQLGWRTNGPPEVQANIERYSERLRAGIARAIVDAHARLQPAEIGWNSTNIPEELHNRRWRMKEGSIPPDPFGGTTDQAQMNPPRQSPHLVEPAGPIDPQLYVLAARALDGRPLALLAVYSLHYVGGAPPGQVSADYFGEFARRVAEDAAGRGAGGDFVAILANGTSGDVNNIDFRAPAAPAAPMERIRAVAGRVARGALEAAAKIDYRRTLPVDMIETELTLARRKPTPEGYEQAKRTLAEPDEEKLPRRAKPYAERAISLYEGPDTVDIKLQAIRLGDMAIVSSPFETFTETGLEMKKKSPFPATFTIELANGGEGYLPTPEQHALGGYETWLGTNAVEIEASRKMVARWLEMLAELRGRG